MFALFGELKGREESTSTKVYRIKHTYIDAVCVCGRACIDRVAPQNIVAIWLDLSTSTFWLKQVGFSIGPVSKAFWQRGQQQPEDAGLPFWLPIKPERIAEST